MEKYIYRPIVIIILFSVIISCGKSADDSSVARSEVFSRKEKYKFGLIVGSDGFGDNAFNDMHYNGMVEARRKYNITFDYRNSKNDYSIQEPIEELIATNCNVIIGAGYMIKDAVEELSLKYPEICFILNDIEADNYRKNVTSITYKQNEGSFLAGALAAMVSETGNIAILGAVDIPVINDFIIGYKAGGNYIKPDINVTIKYLSDLIKPDDIIQSVWRRPELAKSYAIDLYMNKDVDVIFHASGSSGIGGLQAAKATGKYAIGVDSDQDYLAEGFVLTSMIKNIDNAIVYIIGELLDGNLKNENYFMGLDKDGVGLSPMTFTKDKIPPEYLKSIEEIKADIITGKIVVPTASK